MDSLHCTLDQLVKNVPMVEICCCIRMLKCAGMEDRRRKRKRETGERRREGGDRGKGGDGERLWKKKGRSMKREKKRNTK